MEKTDIRFDAIAPYVRIAGPQGSWHWKNQYRKIYDHEWMYCVSGIAYYEVDNRVVELTKGALLLIEPNIPHSFWLNEENPGDIKWVHFDFEYRQDVYDLEQLVEDRWNIYFNDVLPKQEYVRKRYIFEGRFEMPELIMVKHTQLMNQTFDRILAEYKQHKLSWQLSAKSNLLLIIQMVIDQLTNEGKFTTKVSQNELVKQMVTYIGRNYQNRLTRQALANYFGYNEDYMGKLFKNEMNKSISAYINELRIEKAKELLSNTRLSVQNISELIGYSDIFYFSKKMKTITGLSPSEWR